MSRDQIHELRIRVRELQLKKQLIENKLKLLRRLSVPVGIGFADTLILHHELLLFFVTAFTTVLGLVAYFTYMLYKVNRELDEVRKEYDKILAESPQENIIDKLIKQLGNIVREVVLEEHAVTLYVMDIGKARQVLAETCRELRQISDVYYICDGYKICLKQEY